MERHTFGFHLRNATVDQCLFHLEVGNAIAEQAAGLLELLENMDIMAAARELLRGGKARRSRADYRDALAGLAGRHLRRDPAFLPAAIDNRAFDGLDRHRLVGEVQRAASLAGRGADAAREFREIVRRMEVAAGFLPVGVIDEVIPVRDLVVHRTAIVTIGNAAIHAARSLILHRFFGERDHELAVIANPVRGRQVLAVLPVDFQKTCNLAHAYSPAAAMACAASCACCISRRARRYSTGITLRNLGSMASQWSRICRARAELV